MATPTQKQIRDDLAVMAGGNFTPDALSPDTYDAVLARAKANAKKYAQAIAATYLGVDFDAVLQSHLHLPHVLKLLAPEEPAAVAATAARLLKQYDSLLVLYDKTSDKRQLMALLPDESVSMLERIDRQRSKLRRLLAELEGQG